MKVKLRKATMHCKSLGNFLLAHNCLFCDLKTSIPYSPSQGHRLLKLFIDALILSFFFFATEAVIHGAGTCDIILNATILSHASLWPPGSCCGHTLSAPSIAEDAWEIEDTRHTTLYHRPLMRGRGKSALGVLFHLLSYQGAGNQVVRHRCASVRLVFAESEVRFGLEYLSGSVMLMQSEVQQYL